MGQRFHPFCNHRAVKRGSQADHTFHNTPVFGVGQHVAHKTLVNLEHVHRQFAQVGERRIASAKIVQREVHTKLTAALQYANGLVHVIECSSLQNLQLKTRRRHLGVLLQSRAQAVVKIRVHQVVGADVGTHRNG